MDKFVVRIPREKKNNTNEEKPKVLKQAKIENLKGVVIIEDLERAKIILERSDTAPATKIETLQNLQKKLPCKEVLSRTQIGKTVHKLCRHADPDVAALAKQIYKAWKSYVLSDNSKSSIQVEYDPHTKHIRNKARNLILNAISDYKCPKDNASETSKYELAASSSQNTNDDKRNNQQEILKQTNNLESLAEYIEREVFRLAQNKTTNFYRKTNRKIVLALKYNHKLKLSVITSEIPVEQLVKQYFVEP